LIEEVERVVIEAADAAEAVLGGGLTVAMNRYNNKGAKGV